MAGLRVVQLRGKRQEVKLSLVPPLYCQMFVANVDVTWVN